MTETRTIGRNEVCPCGSGKKYKRCHGVGAAPLITPSKASQAAPSENALPDPSALGNFDPQMMMQMSQALQRLPKGQLQRLQAIMQKAMSGRDVTQEAKELERSLPVDFQNMVRTWTQSMGAMGAMASNGSSGAVEAAASEMPEMTEEQARALVAEAASEGKISEEQAKELLNTPPESKKGGFWQNWAGKKKS